MLIADLANAHHGPGQFLPCDELACGSKGADRLQYHDVLRSQLLALRESRDGKMGTLDDYGTYSCMYFEVHIPDCLLYLASDRATTHP